jgi:uncharacterized protein (DUF1330 family)
MPAYLIVYIEVTDAEKIKQYQAATPAAIAKHGGRFVVRGGAKVTVEGPQENRRVVVVEFPSMEQAQKFWNSPEYKHCIGLRQGAAVFHAVIADGVAA